MPFCIASFNNALSTDDIYEIANDIDITTTTTTQQHTQITNNNNLYRHFQ